MLGLRDSCKPTPGRTKAGGLEHSLDEVVVAGDSHRGATIFGTSKIVVRRRAALALLRQFLAARSIVEVAIRPLNRLTEQA